MCVSTLKSTAWKIAPQISKQ